MTVLVYQVLSKCAVGLRCGRQKVYLGFYVNLLQKLDEINEKENCWTELHKGLSCCRVRSKMIRNSESLVADRFADINETVSSV